MKSLKIIITIAIFSILLTSCRKGFLDVFPKDQLADATFWKTESDATMALTGIYADWESWMNLIWWPGMGDNAFSQFPWENAQVIANGQLNPSNPGRNYFDYKQIRLCNSFLENIGNVTMDEQKKKRYIAEVRVLRAYDYFRKIQFYGDVPLVSKVIPVASEANLSRTSKDSVVAFVLTELGEAAPDLPVLNNPQSGGHFTRGAALALKARLELFEGKYAEAMVSAKQVMDMGVFQLYPNYQEQFLIDNESKNTEVIMAVNYIQDFFPNRVWQVLTPALEGGYSSVCPTQDLVDAYEMANGKTINDPSSGYDTKNPFKNRDPRLGMTIIYPGALFNGRYFNSLDPNSPDYHQLAAGPRTGFCTLKYYKFVPTDLRRNCGQDVVVLRFAEVLLTYAEAAIELNRISEDMYEAIDLIRVRAGMPKVDRAVYNTQAKLRELIRRERRVELALEGLRYFDIKRWDIGQVALNGPTYGSYEGSVNEQTGVVTWSTNRIKVDDKVFNPARKYFLPIPQSEIDANPNVKQNPGY